MATKVVYNACYGGFRISKAAVIRARELGATWSLCGADGGRCTLVGEVLIDGEIETETSFFDDVSIRGVPRHDPILIQVVEELGDEGAGRFSKLTIREVNDSYRITEYDGLERVEPYYGYGCVEIS